MNTSATAQALPSLHVACAADAAYGPYCAAMLHSALEACREISLHVHFLHTPDLPHPILAKLRELVEGGGGRLELIEIGPELAREFPVLLGHFPSIVWYRLLLPRLKPELNRVLYLDCDTLVVDSLLPLWQTDLTSYYAGVVQNLIEPRLAGRHHAFGIPPSQVYFNSGVLLLNLELMRRENCVERMLAHAREFGAKSIWPDQDTLNYVLGPKTRLLHPRWNCQNSFYFWEQAREVLGEPILKEATGSPGILHFEGPADNKPWHYLNRHPYRARYWRHLRSTPFPTPRPSGRTMKNILRRYLPREAYDKARALRRYIGI